MRLAALGTWLLNGDARLAAAIAAAPPEGGRLRRWREDPVR
jgi:hypothetical protein